MAALPNYSTLQSSTMASTHPTDPWNSTAAAQNKYAAGIQKAEQVLSNEDRQSIQTIRGWVAKLGTLQVMHEKSHGRSEKEHTEAKHFFKLLDVLRTATFYLFPLIIETRALMLGALEACQNLGDSERNRRYIDVRLLNARSQAFGVVRELEDSTYFSQDLDRAFEAAPAAAGARPAGGEMPAMFPSYGYDDVSRTLYFSPAVSRSRFPPPSKAGRHMFTVVPDLIDHRLLFTHMPAMGRERLAAAMDWILFLPREGTLSAMRIRRDGARQGRACPLQRQFEYYREQHKLPLAHRTVPFPDPPEIKDVRGGPMREQRPLPPPPLPPLVTRFGGSDFRTSGPLDEPREQRPATVAATHSGGDSFCDLRPLGENRELEDSMKQQFLDYLYRALA